MSKRRHKKRTNPATRQFFERCNERANIWDNTFFFVSPKRGFWRILDFLKSGRGG